MYTANSSQRIGQWAPAVVYTSLPYTGEAALPYMVYKLVWEESPIEEFVSPPMSAEEIALAELYAEFAEEDRELAEMGLTDYARLLCEEETTA
jgi:hypothetical protein